MSDDDFEWARRAGEEMAIRREGVILERVMRDELPRDASGCVRFEPVAQDHDGTIKPIDQMKAE